MKIGPPPLKKLPEIFLMTSHPDSHTTTDVNPDMLSGAWTRNGIPHDIYNIRSIAQARTNRKNDIFMQRWLYINEAHMALDIFRFAVFFLSSIWSEFRKISTTKILLSA